MNEGATYLGSDDQWITFPNKDHPGGALETAMRVYMDLALQLTRPAPLFNVTNTSHITDPVEILLAEIEREQAIVDKLRAEQEAQNDSTT